MFDDHSGVENFPNDQFKLSLAQLELATTQSAQLKGRTGFSAEG